MPPSKDSKMMKPNRSSGSERLTPHEITLLREDKQASGQVFREYWKNKFSTKSVSTMASTQTPNNPPPSTSSPPPPEEPRPISYPLSQEVMGTGADLENCEFALRGHGEG